MKIDYATVGARIYDLRKERGLSQTNLAQRAGISMGHMCQIEWGSTKFSLPLLIRLSEVLETTPGQLLSPDCTSRKTPRQEILEQLDKELASCTPAELSLVRKVVHDMKAVLKEYEDARRKDRRRKQGKR